MANIITDNLIQSKPAMDSIERFCDRYVTSSVLSSCGIKKQADIEESKSLEYIVPDELSSAMPEKAEDDNQTPTLAKENNYSVLKASSAIPFICHPYAVDGILYYDGALGDTIPIDKAFDLGCDRVVLVLTKPRDVVRTDTRDKILARGIARRYPKAAECLRTRAQRYNEGVARAIEFEKQGKVLIIAPESTDGVDTLTKDEDALQHLYQRGIHDGQAIRDFIRENHLI